MLAVGTAAQVQLPPRTSYAFHVYVDPTFGDNAQAWQNNPGPGRPLAPLGQHPTAALNGIGGLLQHAPYSFRTLTGPQGVGAYIDLLSSAYGAGALPWTIPIGGGSRSVEWVVVHCAPGMYAPGVVAASPPQIDGRNGLRWNGEVWPFVLRDRVSLQGTSALDTIFDARETQTAILVVPSAGVQSSHEQSFIDGLTIRGARTNGQPMGTNNSAGAGILIDRPTGVNVTISNCFIVDNTVGLAVDSEPPASRPPHRPIVINCTFARNQIGVWNGDRAGLFPGNTGWSEVSLLNCVVDSWLPGSALPSCPFSGMQGDDLVVARVISNITSWSLAPSTGGIAFNA